MVEFIQMLGTASHFVFFTTTLVFTTSLACIFILRKMNRISADQLKTIKNTLNNLEEGFYQTSLDGKQICANPAFVKLNGYDTEQELLNSVKDLAKEWYVDPARRDEFIGQMETNGKVSDFVSEIYRHKTRERIWITENAWIVKDSKTGKPAFYAGTARDITDTVEKNKTQELLQQLTDHVPGGLFQFVINSEGQHYFTYLCKHYRDLIGVGINENISPKRISENIHPEDKPTYVQSLSEAIEKNRLWEQEFRFKQNSGAYEWCKIIANLIRKDDGTMVWHGYVYNVHKRKDAEQKVEQLALTDTVTELPNREYFMRSMRKLKTQDADTVAEQNHAVCFIGLDNFKLLNDTYGHQFGDKFLKLTAQRLRNKVSENDLVIRFGGDVFVILLQNLGRDKLKASETIQMIANRLVREMSRGFVIDKVNYPATISMGIVMFDDAKNRKDDDLIKGADYAMYEAKKSGRNNFVFHDINKHQSVVASYNLQRDLQSAVREEQFQLHLQPQINKHGKLISAEALVRWHHPERGIIMPNDFIPLAEETGQIRHINKWVMDKAIETLAKWSTNPTLDSLVLSVNTNAPQLLDEVFTANILKSLKTAQVPADRLMIELTEHAMAREPERVAESMVALRKSGLRFSLDDFGTGYASLSQLKQFPFDELKIDGSFITGIAEEEDVQSLVRAIIGMAGALNMQTVAEHVATDEQLQFLHSLGCDIYQGYLFSRPLTIHDFEDFATAASVQSAPIPISSNI